MSAAEGEPPGTGAGVDAGEADGAGEAGGSIAATRNLVILLVVAALVRLAGLLGPGHGGDIYAFEMWAEGVARHGLAGYYAAGGDSNYPPMLYLLWPLGLALDGGPLWFAIRLLSIPFDLALGVLLFFILRSRTGRERDGILASGFYLLNPAVVLCGPAWGQVDGMGALPMIGALVAVTRGRIVTAGVLAVLAGLVKPQFGAAAFVLAGMALFWLRSPEGVRRAALMALGALITFVAVLLPLGLGPLSYLDLIGETFRRYSVHSGFAFNPWGAVFGFNHQDGAWFYLGTALEVAAIGASVWMLRWRRDLVGLLAVCSLIALTLYFVPTRAHERYLYGAIALLAPLAVLDRRLRWPFFALSAMFFATLAYVLANSPYRILPGDRIEDFPAWAISLTSVVMTAIGTWVAWRLVQVLRRGAPDHADEEPDHAGDAREDADLPAEARITRSA